jgi:hypothetical protein
MSLKFKQIAVATASEDSYDSVYALTEDGTLYRMQTRHTLDSCSVRWESWWEIVDLPIGDPKLLNPEARR